MSDTFIIVPKLQVTEPESTDQWEVSTTELIKWSQVQGNTITNVKLDYDTASGGGGYGNSIHVSLPVGGEEMRHGDEVIVYGADDLVNNLLTE